MSERSGKHRYQPEAKPNRHTPVVLIASLGGTALLAIGIVAGIRAYDHNHPSAPDLPRAEATQSVSSPISTAASSASNRSKPTATRHGPYQPSPTHVEVPLGTPISYTLHTRAFGNQHTDLLPMNCPPDCKKTVVKSGGHETDYIQLIPPETDFGYRHVYDYTGDPRQILAHSTEIPANAGYFAGQNFGRIAVGDTMDLRTTTGTTEYKAASVTAPNKNTDTYGEMVKRLGAHDILLTTCAVPDDHYNIVIRFVPEARTLVHTG